MSRRARAVIAGLAVACLYLLGATISGGISPLARRPVLDGFAPPPPYRYVKPPQSLAASNQKPEAGSLTVKFDRSGVSEAQVISTNDLQASLIVNEGAFAPEAGQSSVVVRIVPLAPDPNGSVPPGLAIVGNVYQVTVAYQPGGDSIRALSMPGQLSLVAPHSLDGLIHAHSMVASPDGKSWTTLPSNDAITQVGANVISLGSFAVGQRVTGGKKPFPLGRIIYYGVIAAVVLIVGVPILVYEWRRRQRDRRRARHRPPAKRRR
jgi:hypothetical protein